MKGAIKGLAMGSVQSGTYGGSTQYAVFPSVYSYSYYDAEQAEESEKFLDLLDAYLQKSMVNEAVCLGDYLWSLYEQDKAKVDEVHSTFRAIRAKGNSRQELPILFFVADAQESVLELSPYQCQLSWTESSEALYQFLREQAKHFRSELADDFFRRYYGRWLD